MTEPRFDVTTIGEGGLRVSVPAGDRLEFMRQLDVHIAGAEANVVCALSRLGWNCGWVSSLPDTPMGRRVTNEYAPTGVDMSAVVWRENARVSVYYVEYSEPPRPIQVYFDRRGSAFTQMSVDEVDWGYLLDTRLIHLTGITVPLSSNCAQIVTEAAKRAKNRGVAVSVDVNFRNLLWEPEQANELMLPILQDAEIVFCSEGDAAKVFGCAGTPHEMLQQLAQQTGAKHIVMSVASDGLLGWDGKQSYTVPAVKTNIIDRIGAGDGLAAGVIHGWLAGNFQKGLRYGATMAALAMSQHGDFVITTVDELNALVDDDTPSISR